MKAERLPITLGLLAVVSAVSGCSIVSTTVDVTAKAVRTGAEVTASVASAGASVASTGVKTAAAVGAASASAASAAVAAGAAARTAAAATASVAVNGTVALIDLAQRIDARQRADELVHLSLVSQGGGRYLADDGRVLHSSECSSPAGTPAVWVMRRDGRNELRVAPEVTVALRCGDARFVE